MKNFLRSVPGKILLYLLTVVSLIVTAVSVAGAVVLIDQGFYSKTKEEIYDSYVGRQAWGECYDIVSTLVSEYPELMTASLMKEEDENTGYRTESAEEEAQDSEPTQAELIKQEESAEYESDPFESPDVLLYTFPDTNMRYSLFTINGQPLARCEKMHMSHNDTHWTFQFYVDYYYYIEDYSDDYGENLETYYDFEIFPCANHNPQNASGKLYKLCLYLPDAGAFEYNDNYALAYNAIDFGFRVRYSVYPVGIAALLLVILCFAGLMCVSGRRPHTEEIFPGAFNRVPYDLLWIGAIVIVLIELCIADGCSSGLSECIWIVICLLTAICLLPGMCMSTAARIKQKALWKNTVLARICKLCPRILKWLRRGCKRIGRACKMLVHAIISFIAGIFKSIPLIWKTVLSVLVLCIIEFILLIAFCWDPEALIVFWLLEKLILIPAVLYFALQLRRLHEAGCTLAKGDLSYKINTDKMHLELKEHGENLNHIADGMSAAVEERLKSERMKTELITNVSHDIKTPLTSVINYADLISKEDCENEKIKEYTEVLSRQSERLKRLIEDLVEASKASTGNLEVLLAPCDAAVFLTQTAGEYVEKLAKAQLKLVVKAPEQPVRIMADGRRMLRVFDNLMNNICKYAQEGTRVYLTLETNAHTAVITFKNTSRMELNVSADELMERFVRGEASRTTEGNGLGLSIARSLTELQQGSFHLAIDGDLFKVTLRFPVIQ